MKVLIYLTVLGASAGVLQVSTREATQERRGEAVYISEGCIHCHSQYSRPKTLDTLTYGPATATGREEGAAVLIGNRRQGPDLSGVGFRRSRDWNRAHLIDPAGISPGSRMPRYAHLFEGDGAKGEALLDYLQLLGADSAGDWFGTRFNWEPSSMEGDRNNGARFYVRTCQQCHGAEGRGNGPMAREFSPQPANLVEQNYRFIPRQLSSEETQVELARVIKFGVLGSSMPGHEYLTDQQIVDLVVYVSGFSVQAETRP